MNLKRNVTIYDLMSALNADIGENKCGTAMAKLVLIIANSFCYIKMWVIYNKLPKGNNCGNILK